MSRGQTIQFEMMQGEMSQCEFSRCEMNQWELSRGKKCVRVCSYQNGITQYFTKVRAEVMQIMRKVDMS